CRSRPTPTNGTAAIAALLSAPRSSPTATTDGDLRSVRRRRGGGPPDRLVAAVGEEEARGSSRRQKSHRSS
ncbi:MAG: hypothetical protein AVDCRST_MAG38-2959, partial [uncultured Solirubrobacteraceae bacterium]